ncbi:hypothetical protein HMPREF3113_10035 [Stenotrophomonas sp. HMSC10F06]|uniref:hypothetical protein n=1 Tax=Stenotrophomonas sp. HMSC10F06 TaxID=1581081 RepID=UPI0008A4B85B|nr:hypothetical protein [Stenotrophomonas sp. HMSC10F06]OFS93692.1 hypothetical protein HMPREF3113_10035 [Stenotrophomonas sp. HMSC10F06]
MAAGSRRWHRCALAVLLGLIPAASAWSAASCAQGVLEALGWQFSEADVAAPVVHAGPVCERADLRQAQAAGDLRVRLPRQWSAQQRQAWLPTLFDDPGTVCAYAFKLGAATRRATTALQNNDGFRFSALQLGWIGFGAGGAQAKGWERFRSFGRGYQPAEANSAALQTFYEGRVRAECGVGRQVAQLATQRELYGDAAFDREFSADELSIGTFLTLHETDSILLGRHAGEFLADGKAKQTALRGRQAFVGTPGFIEHVFERKYLDDINNQAENFVVVDVSDAAARALREHDGFAYYDQINRRIWSLAQRMPGPGPRRFERLLIERDPIWRREVPAEQQPLLKELDALLDDPFYQGFLIYVHPRGIRPIGYHIARLLDRNPRTPFAIELGLHNLHTTLYRRWIQAQLRQCAAAPVPPVTQPHSQAEQR